MGYLGRMLGVGVGGCAPRPPFPEMTCGFLIQLAYSAKKKKLCGLLVFKVEQETSAPSPKKSLDLPLGTTSYLTTTDKTLRCAKNVRLKTHHGGTYCLFCVCVYNAP